MRVSGVEVGWKKERIGQTKTLHHHITSLTVELSHIVRCRPSGYGQSNYYN